ncbi:GrpB family protein [Paenibacillus massiliensis]|uniref:GrpB family protein n=1 Tax=Paenibacillus massiliensis TaxID=225917 RepID=UPI0004226B09|nr:GrpB family protein [Paenibacillus massiliensis]
MKEVVILEAYNPNWAAEYDIERRKLLELLGNQVISIEHIGSTAVPGLTAKPVIDFMAGVQELEIVEAFIGPLASLGYEHVIHAEFPERRFFRKGAWRAGTHHLHIYLYGSEAWTNQILFRNYLREHPEVREQYQQLKEELAARFSQDRVAYTQGKHSFIADILRQANKENEG